MLSSLVLRAVEAELTTLEIEYVRAPQTDGLKELLMLNWSLNTPTYCVIALAKTDDVIAASAGLGWSSDVEEQGLT
jgi:hypothetical protein